MIVVKVADMALAMGIAAAVGGRAVIADELDNLTALSPYSLRWPPLFNPLILGLYFPFLTALGLDRPVLLAPQSPYFRHSRSYSPSKTPDKGVTAFRQR